MTARATRVIVLPRSTYRPPISRATHRTERSPTTDAVRVQLWWTGSRTVAPGGLRAAAGVESSPAGPGPGTVWAGRILVPVPAGLTVLGAADTGAHVARCPWTGAAGTARCGWARSARCCSAQPRPDARRPARRPWPRTDAAHPDPKTPHDRNRPPPAEIAVDGIRPGRAYLVVYCLTCTRGTPVTSVRRASTSGSSK